MKPTLPFTLTALAALVLAGCNPSSSEGSKDADTQTAEGVFVGSMFQGLQYQVGSETGVLDGQGRFSAPKAQDIQFFVGGIEFGRTAWSDFLSPERLQKTALVANGKILTYVLGDDKVHGLDVVANQMVLLSALDNDEDASNGFNLDVWYDRLKDETVDFNLPYLEFINGEFASFAGRHELSAEPSLHGLGGLVEAAGIELQHYMVSSRTETKLIDGQGFSVSYDYTYNTDGLVTQETKKSDNGADGTVDRVHTTEYSYDSENRQTRYYYTEDRNFNGSADYIKERLYTWNEFGKQLTEVDRTDTDGDGYWDKYIERDMDYDIENRLTREVKEDTDIYMFEPDVTNIYETLIAYNVIGQVASKTINTDFAGDGLVDRVSTETYAYDEAGNRIRHFAEYDNNNDGNVDQTATTVREYDVNGYITLERLENDYNGDGTREYLAIYEFTRDTSGRALTERSQLDTNADGEVNFLRDIQTEYDAAGRKISRLEKVDSNMDGEFESTLFTTFENALNDRGQLTEVKELRDANHDGTINTVVTESTDWNEWDQYTSFSRKQDTGNDGSIEIFYGETMDYDSNQNLIKQVRESDKPYDGTPDQVDTFEYTYLSMPTTLDAVMTFRKGFIR